MSYPSTWKKIKFGDIAKRKSVRIDNPIESEYERYVGLEHLNSGELVVKRWGSTKDVTSNMQIFNKNDILFARRNTYLRRISVALFDGVCSGDIIVIEPILNHIVEGFLPTYMQFEEFENKVVAWSAGAFSKRIKWKQLADFEIWIPSKEEQQKIVDVIWSIHDNQERSENLIQVTEKLKKGLLELLLTKGIGHKKFKKTELGEIPEEWKIKKLKDFCYIKGRIGWRGLKQSEFTKEGPFLITGTDFIEGKINWSTCYHITQERFDESPEIIVKDGDILITKDGTIGKTVFVEELPGLASLNSHLLTIRTNKDMIPKYLYYFFETQYFLDFIESQKSGSTLKGLGQKKIENFLVFIPSIKEQEQILILLEKMNDLIKENKKNLFNCRALKKKLTNEFLSNNLLIPKEVLN